jgi:hypothetical protein
MRLSRTKASCPHDPVQLGEQVVRTTLSTGSDGSGS